MLVRLVQPPLAEQRLLWLLVDALAVQLVVAAPHVLAHGKLARGPAAHPCVCGRFLNFCEEKLMNTELYLTDSCNMKCSFCGSWNQNGVSNDLHIDTIKEYIDTIHRNGYRYLSLSGGEPFLYKHLYEVIDYANQKGFLINVTTNGLLIDKEYIAFVKNKNVITRVSLHTLHKENYRRLTGVDVLDSVQTSVGLLKDSCSMFGIGMTVSDYNINEVYSLAEYAASNNASYIRYTPVYRVYKGTEFNTNSETFYKILHSITRIILDYYDDLEMKTTPSIFGEDILNIHTTKPCGAGSDAYIALNPDLKLVACPVLPHYFELPVEKYESYSNIVSLKEKYTNLLDSIDIDKLEGKCAECLYKTSCRGGCISTKLESGLELTSEQPICINEIVHKVLSLYSERDRKRIIDYWNYWNQKNSIGTVSNKGCIRRLPIWEIHFRRKNDYQKQYRR